MARKPIKIASKISFHKAAWLDCFFFYHLRNRPETYKYFRNSRPVGLFEHIKWFSKIIFVKSDKELFAITVNGSKAGQIRFDKTEDIADISISILKDYMGQGVMSTILPKLVLYYLKKHPEIRTLTAHINKINKPSIGLFEKLNFKKIGSNEREVVYGKKRKQFF